MKTLFIAIDPGVINGIVTYFPEDNEINLRTCNFWTAIRYLQASKRIALTHGLAIKVYCEDPGLISNMYARHFKNEGGFREILKKAQNVGSNKRSAQLIIEYCLAQEITIVPVKPIRRGRGGKLNNDAVELWIGSQVKTNQHCRDAIMILVDQQIIKIDAKPNFSQRPKINT